MTAFKERRQSLDNSFEALNKDNEAAGRFRGDIRFFLEWDLFDREDLTPSPFYRAEAVRDFLKSAEEFHQRAEQIGKDGNNAARKLLNRFDPETLDRKVLGFSPIHEHFDWFIFVGAELKPFVDNRGIQGMKQIQTQEFEQLIRNVCAKNADFREGVRQVNQTANLVQNHLRENNFVDVLDSVELKVDRVDNNLTQVLGALEELGMSLSARTETCLENVRIVRRSTAPSERSSACFAKSTVIKRRAFCSPTTSISSSVCMKMATTWGGGDRRSHRLYGNGLSREDAHLLVADRSLPRTSDRSHEGFSRALRAG